MTEGGLILPSENAISQYFLDQRNKRSIFPQNAVDIILERDAALALLQELREMKPKHLIPTKYWGVIHPDETYLIDLDRFIKRCPTCINAVYTNIWTRDLEKGLGLKSWENLFILSPSYLYSAPFNNWVDYVDSDI